MLVSGEIYIVLVKGGGYINPLSLRNCHLCPKVEHIVSVRNVGTCLWVRRVPKPRSTITTTFHRRENFKFHTLIEVPENLHPSCFFPRPLSERVVEVFLQLLEPPRSRDRRQAPSFSESDISPTDTSRQRCQGRGGGVKTRSVTQMSYRRVSTLLRRRVHEATSNCWLAGRLCSTDKHTGHLIHVPTL
jgi:hypothetical protein